jgi:hypothetical protein
MAGGTPTMPRRAQPGARDRHARSTYDTETAGARSSRAYARSRLCLLSRETQGARRDSPARGGDADHPLPRLAAVQRITTIGRGRGRGVRERSPRNLRRAENSNYCSADDLSSFPASPGHLRHLWIRSARHTCGEVDPPSHEAPALRFANQSINQSINHHPRTSSAPAISANNRRSRD